MYTIIKDSKVIGTSSHEPCATDLSIRGEIFVDVEKTTVNIGDIYSNNTFSPPPVIPLTNEQVLIQIRVKRDSLLRQSDKYMIADYPITDTKRNEWKLYRQNLRDLPDTYDIHTSIVPTPPTED